MSSAFISEQLHPAIIDFYLLAQGVPSHFNDDGRLRDYRTDLINSWRRTLIRDIEFCIACEIRHIHDGKGSPKNFPHWGAWFEHHFGSVGSFWYQNYKSIAHKGREYAPVTDNDEFNEDVKYVFNHHDKHSPRARSYIAAKCAEAQHGLSLIEVCDKAYNPKFAHWKGGFGGSKWHTVAHTLFQLWMTSDPSEIIQLIDTAFALQHNNAVVFDKNKIWAGSDSHSWIMKVLDVKWVAVSPDSLLGYASKPLKEAIAALRIVRPFEVPPKQSLLKPTVGMIVEMEEGGALVSAHVDEVVGDTFQSVKVSSTAFTLHKTVGKFGKVVNFRIYSLPEFLRKVNRVITPNEPSKPKLFNGLFEPASTFKGHGNKPTQYVQIHVAKNPFQDKIAMAYDALSSYIEKHGLTLGTFITYSPNQPHLFACRFRVLGASKPLRFYLLQKDATTLKAGILLEEYHQDDIKFSYTLQNPTAGSIYGWLKNKVTAFIKGGLSDG